MFFSLQELVEWLDDNDFVKALFAGHTQLIRRSGDVLGFLCREKALTEKHIDTVWAAGGGGQDKDRRICVHEVGPRPCLRPLGVLRMISCSSAESLMLLLLRLVLASAYL